MEILIIFVWLALIVAVLALFYTAGVVSTDIKALRSEGDTSNNRNRRLHR